MNSSFSGLMQEHLVKTIRTIEKESEARKYALASRGDALAYQAELRHNLRDVFGISPAKTPLNPQVTGRIEEPCYDIEKVIFHSRPNFPVTALLYIPKNVELPAPAVLVPCGHSLNGKAGYQAVGQILATHGYVVLQYDPIGQGERLQYSDGKGGSWIGACCSEHNFIARQQALVDEFFGSWRVWDGIRACDYLLSRPEVDPKRVAITGNSGGGTLTSLILANDDRYTAAAPSCYITTWRRNAENELPADAEQQPPKALSFGMDMDDLLALHAPKPLLILTQRWDFFDLRGAQQVYKRLQHLYKLFDAEENLQLFTGPHPHGFTQPLRETMCGFFNKSYNYGAAQVNEPEIKEENDETISVTEHGQVSEIDPAPNTVWAFTAAKSRELKAVRPKLQGADLTAVVENALNLDTSSTSGGIPEYRILRPRQDQNWPKPCISRYFVETDEGMGAIVYGIKDEMEVAPPELKKNVVLYVPHAATAEDMTTEPLVKELSASGKDVYSVDLRGYGEMLPHSCSGRRTARELYGVTYFYASFYDMLNKSLLTCAVEDLLRVIDWCRGSGAESVHLVGRGCGSIIAAFAATLHNSVQNVTLKNAPLAFSEWAETENMQWPVSVCVRGILKHLDIPVLYRYLEDRKNLQLIEPWDATMNLADPEAVNAWQSEA